MIRGTHAVIRTAEADDAPLFQKLYEPGHPRSALLSRLRETVFPTVDELAEVFTQSEKAMGPFYAVENREGDVRGFCSLRTALQLREAAFYAEIVVMFLDRADYESPLAQEIFQWIEHSAFVERRLSKLIVHCLDNETELRAWAVRNGFESNGVQREVLFTLGRWHNVETLSLYSGAGEQVPQEEGTLGGNGHPE